MSADFTIGQDDLQPVLVCTLFGPDGLPVDLTAIPGTAVTLHLQQLGGSAHVLGGTVVLPASAGRVKYIWQAGDTAQAGYYTGQWRVDWSSGQESYPNGGAFTLEITPQIG